MPNNSVVIFCFYFVALFLTNFSIYLPILKNRSIKFILVRSIPLTFISLLMLIVAVSAVLDLLILFKVGIQLSEILVKIIFWNLLLFLSILTSLISVKHWLRDLSAITKKADLVTISNQQICRELFIVVIFSFLIFGPLPSSISFIGNSLEMINNSRVVVTLMIAGFLLALHLLTLFWTEGSRKKS